MFVVLYTYLANEVLEKHIHAYVVTIYYYLDMIQDHANDPGSVGADDMEQQRARYANAIDDLLYLLYDSKSDNLDTKEHLMAWFETSYRKNEEDDSVVSTIMCKIKKYKEDLGIVGTTKMFSANSTKELETIYERNSRPSSGRRRARGERHPWALVQKVAVHFDFPYGNEGGVICDTAGFGDKSSIVSWITDRYLREAGALLVTTTASRVRTRSDVDKFLRLGIDLGKDIYLLTTHNDLKAGRHDQPGSGNSEEDMSIFERLLAECETMEEALREVREAEEDAEYEGTMVPCPPGHPSSDMRNATAALHHAENALQRHRVLMRNKSTSECMRNRLRELDSNGDHQDLPVIATNVAEYEQHLAGRGSDMMLTLGETGIPLISAMLYEPISASKYDMMQKICLQELPTSLRCIIATLSNNSLTEHKRIKGEIAEIIKQACVSLKQQKRECLNDIFLSHVVATFHEHEQLDWPMQAEDAAAVWSTGPKDSNGNATTMNANNFKSFCHNKGDHEKLPFSKGGARESLCWNRDLNDIMQADLEEPFSSVKIQIKQLTSHAGKQDPPPTDGIELMISRIHSQFQNMSVSDATAAQDYMKGLKAKKRGLVEAEIQLYTQCRESLDEIRIATIFTHDKSSYTGLKMDASYRAADAVKGGSKKYEPRRKGQLTKAEIGHNERVAIIRDRVSTTLTGHNNDQTNIFRDVGQLVHATWTKQLDRHIATYSRLLDKSCRAILQQLDVYKPKAKKTAANASIEKKLLLEAQKALSELKKCEELLEGCHDWTNVE